MFPDEPYYLFFDTETTGLPKDYNASPKQLDNWPRIVPFQTRGRNFEN